MKKHSSTARFGIGFLLIGSAAIQNLLFRKEIENVKNSVHYSKSYKLGYLMAPALISLIGVIFIISGWLAKRKGK